MSLTPNTIIGFPGGGLETDKKPFLLIDQAFPSLENAYLYRDRVKKREGLKLAGRLQRNFDNLNFFTTLASPWTFNIKVVTGFILTANNANPGQITTTYDHNLQTGDMIIISNVLGAIGYNNVVFTVTVIDDRNFTIGVNAAAFGVYISGGEWISNRSLFATEPNAEIKPGSFKIILDPLGANIIVTDFSKTGSITNITQSDPAVVTSVNHFLTTGDTISIAGVGGMVELNGGVFIITVINANTFSLNFTNSINFTAYTAGGTWTGPIVQGNGILSSLTAGNFGTINYATGEVILTHTAGVGVATKISFNYFPGLPAMGIPLRDKAGINDEQTIFFDTRYAYIFNGTDFNEFIPGTSWNATDKDFFWSTNYRGTGPEDRLFFTTDFINDDDNPIRYTDAISWTDFAPAITSTLFLFQARIIIPYYGRLLMLNTIEGPTRGTAINIYNRCRFSAIGNPVAVDAWRQDIFGKGGFIDAPTNEQIVSAAFFKNTLIVYFERSTWQLRYVGEYGLPFIWNRISSDFGSESTFSPVLFDQGVFAVGDKAITSANSNNVGRIDEKIPDKIFNMRNAQDGVERVHGIRDFQRELVFWCYSDAQFNRKFPNSVLVYNYRNNTFANFRDNVTCFGTLQLTDNITWDRLDIFWDDEEVLWDDIDSQSKFPSIVIGNQQGFISYYGYTTQDEPSLAITAIDLTTMPITLTVPNHNLDNGEIIYLTKAEFLLVGVPDFPLINDGTTLINNIYSVNVIDENQINIFKWDGDNYGNVTSTSSATYIGNGQITIFPRLYVETKDFNPYMQQGGQLKLSYVDFLTDCTNSAVMSVQLFVNSSLSIQGNLIVGNQKNETFLTSPYYAGPTPAEPVSDYAWHRFFATAYGQFIRIVMTYDEDLMNDLTTHQQKWVLNAMTVWTRPGGKVIF